VVVYTGVDTKIEKNNETGASTKVSKAMHTLNGFIVWIFISQLILCFICAIGAGVWFAEYGKDSWYLALSDEWSSSFSTNWFGTNNVFLVGLCSFFTFFILLGNMLPISLYVTIDSFIKVQSPMSVGCHCRECIPGLQGCCVKVLN
jgi:magnesium-transporting ATPase (P-type)